MRVFLGDAHPMDSADNLVSWEVEREKLRQFVKQSRLKRDAPFPLEENLVSAVGRKISRAEALRIAQGACEQAERERREFAELEARHGLKGHRDTRGVT